MKQYILRRVGYLAAVAVPVVADDFLFVRVTGDPVSLPVEPGASPEDIENSRRQIGLDRPLWMQYGHFTAVRHRPSRPLLDYRTPVLELYFQRLPNSLLLAAVAMALSLLIGIPSGILAAVRVGGFWDSAGKIFFMLLGLSLPSFWVGLVLILFFSVYLGGCPPPFPAPRCIC